jgi:hypothetical protein
VPVFSERLPESNQRLESLAVRESMVPWDTAFLPLSGLFFKTIRLPESQPVSVTLSHNNSPRRFIWSDELADSNLLHSPGLARSDSVSISNSLPYSELLFPSALFAATEKYASDWLSPSQLAVSLLTASTGVGVTAVIGQSTSFSVSGEIGWTKPVWPATADLRPSAVSAATNWPGGSRLLGSTADLVESESLPPRIASLSDSAVWTASLGKAASEAAIASEVAVSSDFSPSGEVAPTAADRAITATVGPTDGDPATQWLRLDPSAPAGDSGSIACSAVGWRSGPFGRSPDFAATASLPTVSVPPSGTQPGPDSATAGTAEAPRAGSPTAAGGPSGQPVRPGDGVADGSDGDRSGLSGGAIAGTVIGVCVLAAGTVVALLLIRRRNRDGSRGVSDAAEADNEADEDLKGEDEIAHFAEPDPASDSANDNDWPDLFAPSGQEGIAAPI